MFVVAAPTNKVSIANSFCKKAALTYADVDADADASLADADVCAC